MDGQTDGQTDGRTDDPITRFHGGPFRPGVQKKNGTQSAKLVSECTICHLHPF